MYGFESLLTLYMTHQLFQPGHIEKIRGFSIIHAVIHAIYGQVPAGAAMATGVTGLFTACLWATPLLGGFLADRAFGRVRMIVFGSIMLTLGHFLMGFEAWFGVALLCILVGYGGIGTLKAQVGGLYAIDDHRRAAAYQLLSLSVQFAVIGAPVLCGWLGQRFGWAWGFATAGTAMALALLTYLAGLRWLPADPALMTSRHERPALSRREWETIALLLGLLPIFAMISMTNMQIFNAYLLWGEQHYDLMFFGRHMPASWLVSMDGLISVVTTVFVIGFWKGWARRYSDPDEVIKICVGAAIGPLAPLALGIASWLNPGAHTIGLSWGILFHLINDIGFSSTYAIGMALFSRAAPQSVNTTLMASFTLCLFLASLMAGKLGTLMGQMSDVWFWLLHAGIGTVGFAAMLVATFYGRRFLAPH